jgi:hypothetical protein
MNIKEGYNCLTSKPRYSSGRKYGGPSSSLTGIIFYWKALHAVIPILNPGHKIVFIDFCGMNKKQRSCDGRGGGAAPLFAC